MKEFFKTAIKPNASKKKSTELTVSSSADVQAFLGKVASLPKSSGDARLIFALDATASRQATWDTASQLQSEMFSSAQSLGGLTVQLCYFRGFAEFYKSPWHGSGKEILDKMAGLRCEAGATKIERLLRHALAENDAKRVKCVVYIGDAMEENLDILAQLAGKMGMLNIPLFMFQERDDATAKQGFLELVKLSGGAYSQFDSASAGQFKELLKAVAVYAAGGLRALEDYSKNQRQEVKLLQQQLKS